MTQIGGDMTAHDRIVLAVKEALVTAATTFRDDQYRAYERAVARETSEPSRWAMQAMIDNARIASAKKYPLCDDTGIPHVLVDVGEDMPVHGGLFAAIAEGVAAGQRELPTRPMGLKGGDEERLSQSGGLSDDPAAVVPPAISLRSVPGDELRITVLLLGGGPEIRSTTYRVFHERSAERVIREAGKWAMEAAAKLGCTPTVPAIGIGRTHYEATTLMLRAMAEGDFDHQSDWEEVVAAMVNSTSTGALGLRGSVTALGSFIKVGPQRASGLRMVCMRPGCAVDPRRGKAVLRASDLQA